MSEHINLATVNQKILAEGETLPSVTLRDGRQVQTGTFATLLHNIDIYNNADTHEIDRKNIEQEMMLAVETLMKIGLFTLFSPDEWMATNNKGRYFVGTVAKKMLEDK